MKITNSLLNWKSPLPQIMRHMSIHEASRLFILLLTSSFHHTILQIAFVKYIDWPFLRSYNLLCTFHSLWVRYTARSCISEQRGCLPCTWTSPTVLFFMFTLLLPQVSSTSWNLKAVIILLLYFEEHLPQIYWILWNFLIFRRLPNRSIHQLVLISPSLSAHEDVYACSHSSYSIPLCTVTIFEPKSLVVILFIFEKCSYVGFPVLFLLLVLSISNSKKWTIEYANK